MSGTKHSFEKYQATANDFIFFETPPPLDPVGHKEFIVQICDRHRGVGADGIVYLYSANQRDWEWRFFNRDGSETDLCGNAARCVAAALFAKAPAGCKNLTWKGRLGTFEAIATGSNQYEVSWPLQSSAVEEVREDLFNEISALNDFGLAMIHLVQAGVPHLVLISHEEWSEEHRVANSPQLRRHPSLGTAGANITWVSLKNFHTVTYERGVEAETESCGSGAIASFLAIEHWRKINDKNMKTSQALHFPGGTLTVRRDANFPGKLWLGGEALPVFEGTWEF